MGVAEVPQQGTNFVSRLKGIKIGWGGLFILGEGIETHESMERPHRSGCNYPGSILVGGPGFRPSFGTVTWPRSNEALLHASVPRLVFPPPSRRK